MKKILFAAMLLLASCTSAPDDRDLMAEAAAAMDRDDVASAMTLAAEVLEAEPDSLTAARASMLIADCHRMAGNASAALAYALQAADLDPSLRPMAVAAATAAGQPQMALAQLEQMPAADSAARVEWLRLSVEPALATGREEMALGALRELRADSAWLPVEHLSRLAIDYLRRGMADSAARVMEGVSVDNSVSPRGLSLYADYLEAAGRADSALSVLRRAGQLQDSLLHTASASGVYGRLYDLEHQRRLNDARGERMRWWIAAGAIAALLICCAALLLYQRSVSRRRLVEAQNRLLLASKELHHTREQSRSRIGRLFRDSFDSVELSANLLIEGAPASRVMRELTARVDACRAPEFQKNLEDAVNEYHNGIIARLRELPSLNEADVTTALFCAAGLSPRVVCLLLGCTPSALYNKKYRLKRKIADADISEEMRAEFLSLLS